jgi:hypothetical protein
MDLRDTDNPSILTQVGSAQVLGQFRFRAQRRARGFEMKRIVLIIFAFLLVASSCTRTGWYADDYEISGEFRADGSCSVLLDGEPVVSGAGRTSYDWGRIEGMVLESREVHTVDCVWANNSPGPRYSFFFMISFPDSILLVPDTYRISEIWTTPHDSLIASASLFHPRFRDEGLTGAYLKGTKGTLSLIQVDSTKVVGQFRFRAQRRARGL